MDDDPYNVPAILQSYVPPGFSGIITAPHTTKPFRYVPAHGIFTLAHIEDGFIRRSHCHGTDRAPKIFIRYVGPVTSAIRCFPDTAAGGTEIKKIPVFIAAGNRTAAATPEGPYQPVFHVRQERLIRLVLYHRKN